MRLPRSVPTRPPAGTGPASWRRAGRRGAAGALLLVAVGVPAAGDSSVGRQSDGGPATVERTAGDSPGGGTAVGERTGDWPGSGTTAGRRVLTGDVAPGVTAAGVAPRAGEERRASRAVERAPLVTAPDRAGGGTAAPGDDGALRATGAPPARPAVAAIWVAPCPGPLTSTFGARWGRLHAGIDLAPPYGAPVVAVTDGVVLTAQVHGGYGQQVAVAHADGTVTTYSHLSELLVTPGPVAAGQLLGRVGSSGRSTGPHLHFEVRAGGVTPVDPLPWLAERGVVLVRG